jgi:ATPase subunit of ABC transporter with duplicated ATPase domains
MKQPGQPPNWGQQQQQRMRQQQQQQRMRQQQQQFQQQQQRFQQQQRRAAGYAWQQQKQREQEAQRAQAQRLSQSSAVPGWQEGGQIAPLPAASPRRRSCLGTVVTVVGILFAVGLCLFIAAVILSS